MCARLFLFRLLLLTVEIQEKRTLRKILIFLLSVIQSLLYIVDVSITKHKPCHFFSQTLLFCFHFKLPLTNYQWQPASQPATLFHIWWQNPQWRCNTSKNEHRKRVVRLVLLMLEFCGALRRRRSKGGLSSSRPLQY